MKMSKMVKKIQGATKPPMGKKCSCGKAGCNCGKKMSGLFGKKGY
jgi:hypothetical protein